jgi:hypothetical protein
MVIGHRRGNSTFFIGKSSTNSIAIFIDRRALPIHISVFVVFVGEIPLSHLKKKNTLIPIHQRVHLTFGEEILVLRIPLRVQPIEAPALRSVTFSLGPEL